MRQPWITDTTPSRRYPHYTRANAGEVLADPVTPLAWTFLWQEAFAPGWCDGNETTGNFAEGELDPDRPQDIEGNFGGYYYINLSSMRLLGVRSPDVTVEQLEAALLGAHPDVPPYVPHPDDDRPDLTAVIAAHSDWVLSATVWPELDEDRAAVDAARLDRAALPTTDAVELVAYARSLKPLLRRLFARHAVSSFGAATAPAILAGIGVAIGISDLPTVVLAGLGDIESTEPVRAQWQLSRTIRATPRLSALFDQGVDTVVDALDSGEVDQGFAAQWRDYLQRYGYRGPSEWELISQSYETDPRLGLTMLDRIRHQNDDESPDIRAERYRHTREKTVEEVRSAIGGHAEHTSAFEAGLRAARFLAWRERTKSSAVKATNNVRVVFNELSRRAAVAGELADPRDLYMLTSSELDAYLADPVAMRDELADRRTDWNELFTLQPPFIISAGEVPPLHTWARRTPSGDSHAAGAAGTVLHGLAGSTGIATGRARVLADPFDADRLEPGDVLVAANTDPSWTPLFLVAGAIVVDTGSPISHAVVVSRELGLPCVVSAANATSIIPDGAEVTVDGSAGTVRIH